MLLFAKESAEVVTGVSCWVVCSVGMMIFNKLAIKAFPVECTLVALQMAFTALVMVACAGRSIHIGSFRDVLRWTMVVPFFTGMLLTSILALKDAPMTLVITLKALSPVFSLGVERFYPNPIGVSFWMIFAIAMMILGTILYTLGMPRSHWSGVGWCFLNVFFSICDRLLQRLMLAKDQYPVDISKTGVTFLNNIEGMVPLIIVAWLSHEFHEIGPAFRALDVAGIVWVVLSCLVGVGISYFGIWAQSLISATSFLVLVNANKFFIIFVEAFCMHSKVLKPIQIVGAAIAILAGVGYGKARELLELQASKKEADSATEQSPLVKKV
mmetsp:Transcript_87400/g.203285  ORF Transcript_87400/g.203285 Transcript_87400/m.203285 type:complete len:326 (-) Transcript_87400:127-1104(-)